MKKKNYNFFWFLLSLSFFIFLAYIIAYDSGYYAASVNKKTKITEAKMEEFENDVKNGIEVDLNDYIENNVDYSSKMSKLGSNFSKHVDKFVENDLSNFFSFLGKLFT